MVSFHTPPTTFGRDNSNTTPHPICPVPKQSMFVPPLIVVPYRFPDASGAKLATGDAPSVPPVKLWRVCSLGLAASADTDSKPSAIEVAHRDPDNFFITDSWRKPSRACNSQKHRVAVNPAVRRPQGGTMRRCRAQPLSSGLGGRSSGQSWLGC